LWVLANEVNSLAVSSQRVHRSEGKLIKPSKECVRTCKNYISGREITTVPKIAMDNAILKLCDSCDYFARPLLIKNTN